MHAAAARMALHRADLPRAHAELTLAQRLRPALTYAVPHFAVQARTNSPKSTSRSATSQARGR